MRLIGRGAAAATLLLLAMSCVPPVPPTPPSNAAAVDVGTGAGFACALLDDGGVQCWGDNDYGQLGNGTTTDSASPVTVTGVEDATQLFVGGYHACVLHSSATVSCWGRNDTGELGNGTYDDSATPVNVAGLVSPSTIGGGDAHSCAIAANTIGGFEFLATVFCWGDNQLGQLGGTPGVQGGIADSNVPLWSPAILNQFAFPPINYVEVDASAGHTCVRLESGEMTCWGINHFGEIGTPSGTGTVGGIASVGSFATGLSHTCAAHTDQSLTCWGDNSFSQLGDGTTIGGPTATAVLPAGSVAGVSSGGLHTCAIAPDGSVSCWGDNDFGQLGRGYTSGIDELTPAAVPGASSAVAIDSSFTHTCIVGDTGGVQCWGSNEFGQLGDGTATDSPSPVSVSGIG